MWIVRSFGYWVFYDVCEYGVWCGVFLVIYIGRIVCEFYVDFDFVIGDFGWFFFVVLWIDWFYVVVCVF